MTPKCYSYIRFSTPEQLKGDSLRRQLKLSEDYAREKGLELDQSMKDLGISAFKGQQRTKGALGRFLSLVSDGKIPKGSTLIVESLDRLSRQTIQEALRQFLDLTKAGIRIVTLADRMEYDENTEAGQIIMSLTIMSRAYEESLTKAKRLKSAWDAKRSLIGQKKLTAKAPEWLKLSEDKTQFIPIPERVDIINHIYHEKLVGKGSGLIAKELNQRQCMWTPKGGWRDSYISKILNTSAVIGEYQPHQMTVDANNRRQRIPIGDSIPDYFPKIVSDDLFYSVKQQMEQRARLSAGNGGGRTGKIRNLFGYIAKCGYCGSSMAFLTGKPSRPSYFVCDAARRRLPNCKRRPIRYEEFEEIVLTYCKGLNPADLMQRDEQETALKALQGQLLTVQGHLKEFAGKINNLADSIATTDNSAVRRVLEKQLAEILDKQASSEVEAKQLSQEIERLSRINEDEETRLKSIRELLAFLHDSEGEELIEVRRRLREELRGLIDRIDVFPVGRTPMTPELVKQMRAVVLDIFPDMAGSEELKQSEADLVARIENKALCSYFIYFKGGSFRSLVPAKSQKLVWEFDREGRRVRHLSWGIDGEAELVEM